MTHDGVTCVAAWTITQGATVMVLACGLMGPIVLSWALPVVTAHDTQKDLEQRVAGLESFSSISDAPGTSSSLKKQT
jgi:hypothetical protein